MLGPVCPNSEQNNCSVDFDSYKKTMNGLAKMEFPRKYKFMHLPPEVSHSSAVKIMKAENIARQNSHSIVLYEPPSLLGLRLVSCFN